MHDIIFLVESILRNGEQEAVTRWARQTKKSTCNPSFKMTTAIGTVSWNKTSMYVHNKAVMPILNMPYYADTPCMLYS